MYRHHVIVTFATVTVRNRDLISSSPSTADVVKQDIMQRHLVIVAHCIVGEPGCTATVTLHQGQRELSTRIYMNVLKGGCVI